MALGKHFTCGMVLLSVAFASCQQEPTLDGLYQDYMVYTDVDQQVDFTALDTFYLPDSILLFGKSGRSEYWKDTEAQQILTALSSELEARNFTRTTDKSEAHLGVQVSYIEQVTYYVGYNEPYWWWNYPYYWSPNYWGNWSGWYYPYEVYYGYTSGSMIIEMVNLSSTQRNGKLPIVWNSFIGGLLTSSQYVNLQRTLTAIDQAFEQSPDLTVSSLTL
jgi:hypothetical protein